MITAGRRYLHGFASTETKLAFANRITRAKGSSEYCISHLLAPGAYARMPLVNRVQKLKIPVVFSCMSLPAFPARPWLTNVRALNRWRS